MRYFWSIYLVMAVAGTAGVYVAAPLARPYIPDFLKILHRAEQRTETAESPPPLVLKINRAPPAERQSPADAPAPDAPSSRSAAADEMPPALHGIYLVQRGEKAGWGVTRQQASYYMLDGARAGTVDGGALLDFQGSHSSSKGNMVECRLHAAGIPAKPLLVSAADVHLFTGDYRKLSANQLADLKAYYALSGKIAQRKKELLQISAQKNPFFETYQAKYKILMAHVDKAKALTTQRDKAIESERLRIEDKLREMKVSENRLRQEYQDFHQRFKTWKEQHAGEIPQPEKDPSIQQWTRQRAALAPRVPGLAY
jgi:hypothetical protein